MVPRPLRLWTQLLTVYASLEGALWTAGAAQIAFSGLTVALAVVCTLSEPRFWPDLGLDPRSIRRGWWIAPIAAAIAALILLAAWHWHTLRLPTGRRPLYVRVLLYVIWALMQQFLLQSFFFLRLERLLQGGRRAVIAAAFLFSSAHLPNPVLVPVTLAGGLVLSRLFRRYRTIYLLAFAQVLVALSLATSVPQTVIRDLRVGRDYVSHPSQERAPKPFHPGPARP